MPDSKTFTYYGSGSPLIFSNKPSPVALTDWTKENDKELREKLGLANTLDTSAFKRLAYISSDYWAVCTKVFIERVSIVCDLTPETFVSKMPKSEFDGHVKTLVSWMSEMDGVGFMPLKAGDKSAKVPFGGKAYKLTAGPRGATVHLSLLKPQKKTGKPARLRLDFNPRKIGAEAVAGILGALHEGSLQDIKIPILLNTARVTRFDVAVDLIGVKPVDLLVSSKAKVGVINAYFDAAYTLQSGYAFTGKSAKGSSGLKVYDRQAAKAAKEKGPVFDGLACTRVEVTKSPKKQPIPIGSLQLIANALAGLRVGWLPELYVGRVPGVRHLLDALRIRGFGQTMTKEDEALALSMKDLDSKLVVPDALWAEWPSAVADAGLTSWSLGAADHVKNVP